MMKSVLAFFLCGIMLLCFTACDKNVNMNTQPTEFKTEPTEFPTQQTELPTEPTVAPTEPTTAPTAPPTEPAPTESTTQADTDNQTVAIFNTKNIKRITLYAYYGWGNGSDVPAEHLDEIIAWLDSFSIGSKAPEILPPGTNTIYVEIEYLDGTITRQGTDITTIDGVTYYLRSDDPPDCYGEIISKTSIS